MPSEVRVRVRSLLMDFSSGYPSEKMTDIYLEKILAVIGEETIKMERKSYKSLACEFGRDWTQGYNQCLTDLRARLERK